MTICTVKLPAGKSAVTYGALNLGVSADGSIDIPQYVGKSLVGAGCTTTPALSQTVAQYLDGLDTPEAFEANYLVMAYGQTPGDDVIAQAKQLLADRGEPAVNLT